MMIRNLFITGMMLFAVQSYALNASIATTTAYQELTQQATSETFKYTYYFTFALATGETINLAAFAKVNANFPLPAKDYDRDSQFGEWIRPIKSSCLNTRGVVLQRDSSVGVSTNSNCTVTAGQWYDPYTNKNYTDADDIQIDHVVALKNAYMTGAHAWTDAKRCLYANYLGNDFHLLSVNGPENMRKSDKSPLEWTPPNKSFICDYLRHWLEIKFIWELKLTPREVAAIENQLKENQCSTEDMTVSAAEIQANRRYMEANKNLCQ